jgi:tRNA 2-selenouridine synthase
MRSAGVAWLLDLYGFRVYTLSGGYKSFRRWVINSWEQQWNFKVVGGYTGSGKTKTLKALEKSGEQVIDLEELANHRGSAFGAWGLNPQPTQEMFENLLALKLFNYSNQNFEALQGQSESFAMWIEDESQRIGTLSIPQALWDRMRTQPIFFLEIPFRERLKYLMAEYGKLDKADLASSITRIQKRLGGLETKTALNCLIEDDIHGCFSILLKYYDKLYWKGLQNRNNLESLLTTIEYNSVDAENIAQKLINSNQIA